MATLTPKKVTYYFELNNGTTETGQVKTVKVSLGSFISKTANDTKALALMAAIEEIFTKTTYEYSKIVNSTLES